MWYVIQVVGGKERRVLSLIKKIVDSTAYEECFIPQYEAMKKLKGQWRKCTEILFPGYLFLVTNHTNRLAQELHNVPAFTKLLSNGGQFIPLNADEIAWISAFTRRESRIIEMSEGIIEGDKVIILKGPLTSHSGLIRKIDRHKRIAYLDIGMFGRTMTVKVGVEIVRKR
ncbi:MAG: antiterminator LoaP [Coriobacteriales bacterium]|nr:antiterminator LoaP [Coriobacteriales bacterium]